MDYQLTMAIFTKSSSVDGSAAELFHWHARYGGFQRLVPPWTGVRLAAATAGLTDGAIWTIRGPLGLPWTAHLFDVQPGRQFRDRQGFGPFADWQHTHLFEPDGDRARMVDRIGYRLRLGLGARFAAAELDRLFTFRHERLRRDFARHAGFDRSPKTIAVSGSRGLIGRELVQFLSAAGHRIVRLVSGRATAEPLDDTVWHRWQPMQPLDPAVLRGADAVVHLAAEPIAEGRWTKSKRAKILESRVVPTRHLAEAAGRAGVPVFVSASGVGAYGDSGETELTEQSPLGDGFLADVCRDWENAAGLFPGRAVQLRIGVVLTPQGAALGRQMPAFQLGLGAKLATGRQFVPWIGIDDTLAAIQFCLFNASLHGPVNVVAPQPVRQEVFAETLAYVLHRPRFLQLPTGLLKALVGDVAGPALLASMKAMPAKLLAAGFRFDGTDLESELRYLLGKKPPA
jgi:uncharacterized protein